MLRVLPVALLLFGSGLCALVYQIAWAREFRLVFGGTTAASGAVLAIFMGGLGVGNALFGRIADRQKFPLRMYALLELAISLAAAVSPWVTDLIRILYVRLGGELTLGSGVATVVRLLFSIVVLGLPTCLMGGTLPAAVRAVTSPDDRSRRGAGLVYGLNTLGAVAGAGLCTFLLLEHFGTRSTLWVACAFNCLIAGAAYLLSRVREKETVAAAATDVAGTTESAGVQSACAPAFVYLSAAVAGLAFFLMEMVWFRMLSPLLGGTTYSLGVVLVMALFGIGLGGAAYPLGYRKREPGAGDFAWTCALEAAAVVLPYALGDRLAVLAASLAGHAPEGQGLWGKVVDWGIISAIVILPSALVSGWQFPMLIALLGRGKVGVGKQVGLTFAANTVGAITGLLLGGFGILTVLTAPGCWRVVTWLLVAMCLVAVVVAWRRQRSVFRIVACLVVCGGAVGMLQAEGPTVFWRHNPIGAGRTSLREFNNNDVQSWKHQTRRTVLWEADGKEACVAIAANDSLSFMVNGKSDGNASVDMGTQVILGLVGAVLHPDPQDCLVVGLGTGESAGWAAACSKVKRVDVVEIEPVVTEMARRCAPVNNNVLDNPKIRMIYNDAREVLLTTPQKYDVIISEPSNLYRVGVPNLYTREFYQAVRGKLKPGGVFVQWLQTYEADPNAIRTVFATLQTAFPHREAWGAMSGDVVLVCREVPPDYDADQLRQRLRDPGLTQILQAALHVQDLEGWLALYLIGPEGVEFLANHPEPAPINTDDKNIVEYKYARSLGSRGYSLIELYREGREKGFHRPKISGSVDWESVDSQYMSRLALSSNRIPMFADFSANLQTQSKAYQAYVEGRMRDYIQIWAQQPRAARKSVELQLLTAASAFEGHAQTLELVERLRATHPWEADALKGFSMIRAEKSAEARVLLAKSVRELRTNPWPHPVICRIILNAAQHVAMTQPTEGEELYEALSKPFAIWRFEEDRRWMSFETATRLGNPVLVVDALKSFEPNVPFQAKFLISREEAYRATQNPLAVVARRDLEVFRRQATVKKVGAER